MHNIGVLGIRRLLEGFQEESFDVLHQDTFRARPGFGYVRTLSQDEELPMLCAHLLRLDPESRHDRFNGFLDDSFIERYAEKCANDGTIIVAYMENGEVRGAAELHPPGESADSLPEIAFSVEACVRRRGVGSVLFKRLISEARWKGYRKLRVTTGARNRAMRALAAKFGADLVFRHGESTGTIDLRNQPQDELAKLAIDAPIGAMRALLNLNHACWKLVSRVYGSGRAA
jgi:GNAT superfamily N-acetyltransferase